MIAPKSVEEELRELVDSQR